jgi:renalase
MHRLSWGYVPTGPSWEAGVVRVVVVGAGLSGLIAAQSCIADGHTVIVLDKGRGPGGRLATRRIAGATFDHGAQFFTVRSTEFTELVNQWNDAGLISEWCRGFTSDDGHPRWVANGGMNAIAKHLTQGLDVRCSTLVFAIRPNPVGGWSVGLDDGTSIDADAVIVTCPLPQSYSLIVASGVTLPEALMNTDYERTLGLLAVLDGPSAIPAPGGLQHPDEVFSFIGDNVAKGVSTAPAVTFHANAAWSAAHWDDDHAAAHQLLLDAAAPWLASASVVESQFKRWRFATPLSLWPDACWSATAADGAVAPMVLAGDAFKSARMEGAALSGLAAARALSAAG